MLSSARGRDSGFFLVSTRDKYENDEELLAGMLANLPGAWRVFQQRYDRLVHRCITKVTRRFSQLISADDVREIYATLYVSLLANDKHKLRSFDPARGNRFSSWIGLLAINCAYDYLRSLRREPHRECLAEASDLAADTADPFEITAEHEQARIAESALQDFSEKDRTFAFLYFAEGMEPEAIATRMNISVKTVFSKKHKIQSRLELALAARAA